MMRNSFRVNFFISVHYNISKMPISGVPFSFTPEGDRYEPTDFSVGNLNLYNFYLKHFLM